jgi:hypothetical protein
MAYLGVPCLVSFKNINSLPFVRNPNLGFSESECISMKISAIGIAEA